MVNSEISRRTFLKLPVLPVAAKFRERTAPVLHELNNGRPLVSMLDVASCSPKSTYAAARKYSCNELSQHYLGDKATQRLGAVRSELMSVGFSQDYDAQIAAIVQIQKKDPELAGMLMLQYAFTDHGAYVATQMQKTWDRLRVKSTPELVALQDFLPRIEPLEDPDGLGRVRVTFDVEKIGDRLAKSPTPIVNLSWMNDVIIGIKDYTTELPSGLIAVNYTNQMTGEVNRTSWGDTCDPEYPVPPATYEVQIDEVSPERTFYSISHGGTIVIDTNSHYAYQSTLAAIQQEHAIRTYTTPYIHMDTSFQQIRASLGMNTMRELSYKMPKKLLLFALGNWGEDIRQEKKVAKAYNYWPEKTLVVGGLRDRDTNPNSKIGYHVTEQGADIMVRPQDGGEQASGATGVISSIAAFRAEQLNTTDPLRLKEAVLYTGQDMDYSGLSALGCYGSQTQKVLQWELV